MFSVAALETKRNLWNGQCQLFAVAGSCLLLDIGRHTNQSVCLDNIANLTNSSISDEGVLHSDRDVDGLLS